MEYHPVGNHNARRHNQQDHPKQPVCPGFHGGEEVRYLGDIHLEGYGEIADTIPAHPDIGCQILFCLDRTGHRNELLQLRSNPPCPHRRGFQVWKQDAQCRELRRAHIHQTGKGLPVHIGARVSVETRISHYGPDNQEPCIYLSAAVFKPEGNPVAYPDLELLGRRLRNNNRFLIPTGVKGSGSVLEPFQQVGLILKIDTKEIFYLDHISLEKNLGFCVQVCPAYYPFNRHPGALNRLINGVRIIHHHERPGFFVPAHNKKMTAVVTERGLCYACLHPV